MSLVEFEKWKEDFGVNDSKYSIEHYLMEQAFKAGQQSQQGEVNKLQTKIDDLNERHSEDKRILHNVIEMNQAKIDELQARFDKTVNHIEEWYGCVELSNIVDMLKGNKDEN